MTEQDLKVELQQVHKEYELAKQAVIKKYCDANNPYKVGDIITDHIGNARILSIGYYISSGNYCCQYTCDNLLKTGKLSTKEPTRTVFQSNLI